ncbi:AzlC family ABC transporter permease [Acrocarpospora catenulata]|uniref:AzlC family ABC transporter permease n=1 Tax=Acrocarpospora catenulata TaxID=2836182 RepID=UPI001BDB2536|nr:AzlC family ABC transporter permease [Acrocarpospora catenulata]
MISLTAQRRDIVAGARAMGPWLFSIAPFGFAIGVAGAGADLPVPAALLAGVLIFAGSAQLATIDLLSQGAAPLVVIGTALFINIRLVFYSAAVAPHWRGTPWWWRLIAAYALVDPTFAVGADRYEHPGDRRSAHAHYLGGAALLWIAWCAAIATGAFAAARLPGWLHLEFIGPLYLIGAVVPRLRSRPARAAALCAASVAATTTGLPLHLGVSMAIAAGIAMAYANDSKEK